MTSPEIRAENVDDLSTLPDYSSNKHADLVQWRRIQVLKLRAKGHSLDEIVDILKAGHKDVRISHGTVHNDLKAIRAEANKEFSQYIENLPFEHKLALAGVVEIIKKAWETADSTKDDKVRLSALALVKDAILTKQSILGDSDTLEKALSFVQKTDEQLQKKEAQKSQ